MLSINVFELPVTLVGGVIIKVIASYLQENIVSRKLAVFLSS